MAEICKTFKMWLVAIEFEQTLFFKVFIIGFENIYSFAFVERQLIRFVN